MRSFDEYKKTASDKNLDSIESERNLDSIESERNLDSIESSGKQNSQKEHFSQEPPFNKEEQEKLNELLALSFDFARQNDFENLSTLLKYKLNPNLKNEKGDSLLMLASYHNALECVDLLLKNGARVDEKNDKNLTPLSGAIFKGYEKIVKRLLESGADVDEKCGGGFSACNFAVLFGRDEILNELLKYSKKKQKIGVLARIWLKIVKIFVKK